MWWATKELLPNEFRDGTEDASATGRKREPEIPLCKYLKEPSGCHFGAKCQWRHDDTPQEIERARKIRAARVNHTPGTKAAGGVHAQLMDPDSYNPWVNWGDEPEW